MFVYTYLCACDSPPRLQGAKHTFWLIETHGSDQNSLPSTPKRFYFGRELGRSDRSVLQALDLKQRRYLGPTSMDHELALIMCNMGLVRPGTLMHDPFAGTGSILLAAAHRGALVMGADIDIRVIRDGKRDPKTGEQVNIWTNFKDAGLPAPLALLRLDLAQMPLRRDLCGWAHALVCDPPYGIRAGGRTSGGRKRDENGAAFPVPEHLRENHVPSTAFYPLSDCLADLLDVAAKALVMGGRLVYFYPAPAAVPGDYAGLPTHPCLEIVGNSLQTLTCKWGRRLITMRKTRDWFPEARAAAVAATTLLAPLNATRARVMQPDAYPAEEDTKQRRGWETYRGKRC